MIEPFPQSFTTLTPLGCIRFTIDSGALTALYFDDDAICAQSSVFTDPLANQVNAQLGQYFTGTRQHFHLPLAPKGTPFQQKIWRLVSQIPFGQTVTYADLAQQAGNPRAFRAVGNANGKNPLWIVIPCHRVVGHNGALTGYGGGLTRKAWLLNHEKNFSQASI